MLLSGSSRFSGPIVPAAIGLIRHGVIAISLVIGAITSVLISGTIRGGIVACIVVARVSSAYAFTALSSTSGCIPFLLLFLVVLRCVQHVDVVGGDSCLVVGIGCGSARQVTDVFIHVGCLIGGIVEYVG